MLDGGTAQIRSLSSTPQGYVVEVSVATFQSDFVLHLATEEDSRAGAMEQARLWVQQLGEPFASGYCAPGSLK